MPVSLKYQLNIADEDGWRVYGGRVRPAYFPTIGAAKIAQAIAADIEGITATQLIRVETVDFCDLETKEVFQTKHYTGLREDATW